MRACQIANTVQSEPAAQATAGASEKRPHLLTIEDRMKTIL